MGKIVAIGGGEIGRPKDGGGFYPIETLQIDKETIKLTNKRHPKLLFLPTASKDSRGYFEVIKKYFGKKLGCQCDVLYLINCKLKAREIRNKLLNSDIIYVGGGNTLNMLNVWKDTGADKILEKAYKKGIVLSGVSAGAICWFRYGNSDSRPKIGKKNYGLIRVRCLNFLPLAISPHHTREINRKKAFINIMKRTPGVGIALEDCSALEIINDKYRIISSNKIANAYKVYSYKKGVTYEKLAKSNEFRPLSELLSDYKHH